MEDINDINDMQVVDEDASGKPLLVFRHEVVLTKEAKRKLNDDAVGQQAQMLLSQINTKGRVAKGWLAEWDGKYTDTVREVEGSEKRARGKGRQLHTYGITFTINCKPDRPRKGIDAEFRNMVGILVAASNRFPSFVVSTVDGEEAATDTNLEDIKRSGDEYVGYAPFELPSNVREKFGHIYDRDAQIGVVLSAIEAAMRSDWTKRFHVVLQGPPACGKTEVLNTIKRMVGPDAVLVFDGTSTTQAGAQKEFTEREELPRVMIIEEIEKTDESALRYLLGLLDARGEIRKQTAREKIVRDARVLCFATVNDIDKFKGMLSGALASRFAHDVYCPRPDRDLMRKILLREVNDPEVNGDEAWVEPTLDYMEEIKSSDPRKAIAICLSGRDGWMDGSYPAMLREIRKIGAGLGVQ